MKVSERTLLGELLRSSPEVRELLTWYGIEVDTIDPQTRLESLCLSSNLDFEDLRVELEVLFFDPSKSRPG